MLLRLFKYLYYSDYAYAQHQWIPDSSSLTSGMTRFSRASALPQIIRCRLKWCCFRLFILSRLCTCTNVNGYPSDSLRQAQHRLTRVLYDETIARKRPPTNDSLQAKVVLLSIILIFMLFRLRACTNINGYRIDSLRQVQYRLTRVLYDETIARKRPPTNDSLQAKVVLLSIILIFMLFRLRACTNINGYRIDSLRQAQNRLTRFRHDEIIARKHPYTNKPRLKNVLAKTKSLSKILETKECPLKKAPVTLTRVIAII